MQAQDIKLLQLLQSDEYQFIIPPYQRDYRWDKTNILCLLEALEHYKNSNDKPRNYYLGNIILKEKKDEYIVVDGQQRLTTISLIIRVFYHLVETELKKIKNDTNGYKTFLSELKNILFYKCQSSQNTKLKIYFQTKYTKLHEVLELSNDLETFVNNDLTNLYKTNLKIILSWFKEKINKFTPEEKIEFLYRYFLDALQKVAVAKILLDEKDDECVVFETINSLAKPLTEAELIKNWLYMKSQTIENYDDREYCQEFYTDVLEKNLLTSNNQNDKVIVSFLSAVAEKRNKTPFQLGKTNVASSIYFWYKENVPIFNKNVANEMLDFLNFYQSIFKEGDLIQTTILEKYIWNVLNTIYNFNKDNYDFQNRCFKDKKKLNTTILNLNRFYILKMFDKNFSTSGPTESSRIYKFLVDKNSDKPNVNPLDWKVWEDVFCNAPDLKFQLPRKKQISKALLFRSGKIEFSKLLFWAIEKHKNPTFDNWDDFISNKNVTAEHIFPQNWENTKWKQKIDNSKISDILNYSGNIVILEPAKNSKNGNKPLEEKIKEYENSRFQTTREIVPFLKNGWNLEAFEKINNYFLKNIFAVLKL